MRATLLLVFSFLFNLVVFSQTSIFHENFESPSLGDSVTSSGTPSWASNTTFFSDGLKSFSNSVQSTGTVSLTTNTFSASSSSNVILQFSHICKIEFGDSAFIEVSINGGSSWIQLTGTHYQGTGLFGGWGNRFSSASYATDWDASNSNTVPTNTWWKTESFDISAIAANQSNVKVRFRLADGSVGLPGAGGAYGWIIDNIKVNGALSELIPPVVTLNSPIIQDTVYGTGPFAISATCTDASGIAQAKLVYWLNSGNHDTLNMTKTGNIYTANIPSMSYNNKVYYYVYAVDSSLSANTTTTSSLWFYNKKGPSVYVIGSGTAVNTSTSYPTPYGNYYWGSKDQYLIKASELTAAGMSAGPITSISFDVTAINSCPSLTGFTIKIGNTTQATMATWVTSGLTQVYSGAYQPTVGWNMHTFTTPYNWDGTSNLVIEACFNNTGYVTNGNAIVNQSTTSFVSTINYHTDASGVCASTSTTSTFSQRPNIKIAQLSNSYANDAGIFQIIEPASIVYTSASIPVKVSVKNFGTDTLKKATVGWTVDGVAQTNAIWTGSMLQDVSSTAFTIGNYSFPVGNHTLKIWTKLPNDSNDMAKLNDTLTKNITVCSGIMSGSYSIAASGGDFTSITAAINQLNTCGLNGPVTLNVAPGTYIEQLDMTNIVGTSPINTVTIKSANGDSTSVILQWNTQTGNNFVMRWNNCHYIHIKGITLQSVGTTNGRVLDWTAGASYNSIQNCVLLVPTGTASTLAGIYMSGTNNSFNTVKNNKIVNGYYGIYLYGVSTSNTTKYTLIENNIIENPYYYGIYCYYSDSLMIRKNVINKTGATSTLYALYSGYAYNKSQYFENIFNIQSTSTIYGLYGYYNYDSKYHKNEFNISNTGTTYCMYPYYNYDAEITNNKLNLNTTGTTYGIYDYGTTSSNNPVLIANNFVNQTGTTTSSIYGAYFSYLTNTLFYNNTVQIGGGSTTSAAAYVSSGSGLHVRNNILINKGGGYAYYVSTIAAITSSDYNDLYVSGTNLGYWSAAQTNLAAWKTASTKDTNSISILPIFTSATDLHTNSVSLNNLGTPLTEVTTDIDGEIRNTVTPDMGADEFTPPNDDAGIVSIGTGFTKCQGVNQIPLVIKNGGLNTLTSVTVNWSVNGVLQTPVSYNTNLLTAVDTTVIIGNYSFAFNTAHNLKIWVSSPNNLPDQYALNDTLVLNNIYPRLTGTYTIGASGSDFTTFTAASNYLVNNGVCGPVTFQIAGGTYNESVTISEIPGANTLNTITFKPATSANVVLTNSSNFTLKLNGADYVTFDGSNAGSNSRNFSIINTSTATNTAVVWLASLGTGLDCRYNTIKNCIIEGGSNNANSSFGIFIAGTGISNSGSANGNDNITIQNNQIQNAWYGIYARGTSTDYIDSLLIVGNEIGSADQNKLISAEGIEVQAIRASQISNNNIFNLSVNSANHLVGIQLLDYNKNTKVFGNKVHDFVQTSTTAGYAAIAINISASNNDSIFVYNNMVWRMINFASTSTYYNCGIRVNGGTNHKIYFNSVNLYGSYLSTTAANISAAYVNGTPTGIDVRDNIFANSMTGAIGSKAYSIYCTGTANPFGQIGFNNYDASGTQSVVGYFNSADKTTLSAWKSSISNDTASLSVASGFYASDNLHSYSNILDNAGSPVSMVTQDFDGETRNLSTPDIGADEFMVNGRDAGILALNLTPFTCPGLTSIPVKLKNFGSNNLNKVQIDWSVNGVMQTSTNYVGTLLPFTDVVVNVGTYTFAPNTSYTLKFWTSNPNDSVDGNTANDTLVISNYYSPLSSGNYTVGSGKDFTTPFDAASYISNYGICGPVTFSIDPGTYTGQLILNPVPGASATNTIVFQSANNDSTSVNITYTPTSTTFNFTYTVYMNGIDYLTLKNISMLTGAVAGGTGRVIGITSGANYNTIKNCRLLMPVSTSGSIAGIIKNQSSNDNFNLIENNYFYGGQNGINYVGLSTSSLDSGTIIRNNKIVDFSNNAITISNQDSLSILGNTIISYSGAATPTGLNLTACNNSLRVLKNKIHIQGTGSLLGITLSNCNANAASRAFLANNFISSVGSAGTGLSINNSNYQNIVYNSVNTNLTSNSSYAFYINGGANNNILNNNFVHPGSGYAYYVNSTSAVNKSNYNNIFSPVGNFAYWTANRANLTALATANNKDTNSVSSNPYYISASDLHTYDVVLNSKATPIVEVSDDIDGTIRNLSTPDIGADEFVPLNKDLQHTILQNPGTGCSLSNVPVTIKVKNVGLDTIGGSFIIGYQIAASSPIVTETVTSNFNSGQELSFTFSQTVDLWANKDSLFNIKTFIAHSNDLNPGNDTIISSVLSKYTPKLNLANDTVPWNTSKTLTVSSSDSIHWYNNPSGGSIISYGTNYTTPVLTAHTNYYLETFAVTTNPITTTLGTGVLTNASTGFPTPYGNYYWGSRQQFLITAAELTALGITAGNINSLAFDVSNVNSCPALTAYEIKIGNTSLSAMGTTWQTGLTSVYTNSSYQPVLGWNTHLFSTPFVWNGTSNIIIETCFNNSSYLTNGNASVNQTATSYVSSLYFYNDATGVCTNTSTSGTMSQRPNMKFNATGIVQGCTSQRYPLHVVVTGIPTKDIATDTIVLPASACNLGIQTIKTRLYNAGIDTLKGGITVKYMINNQPTSIVTEISNDTIAPGTKKMYTFTTPVSFIAPTNDSIYNIAVFANVATDNNHLNDTTKGSTIAKYTPAPPVIANQTIPYASSTTLSLTTNDSLLWYHNPTDTINFFGGTSYTTPTLYDTTTYYVSAFAKTGGSGIYQVGTGTLTNGNTAYPTPYGNYWWGSKDQYLFTAAELNALGITAGNISSIAWDVSAINSVPGLTDFTIKMDTTSQTALSSLNTLAHTVYTNTSYQPVAGWNTHNFSTPFYWNGVSNILVEACFNNSSYVSGGCASVNQTTTSFVSTLNYHADASGVCASTSTPTTYSQRPNVKFNASNVVVGCGSSMSPVTVIVTNIPRNDASVNQIISPQGNLSMNTVQQAVVKITNYGYDTLKKVTINWSSNNVLQTPFVWTGVLPSGNTSSNITIGSINFNAGTFAIKAWTSLPNDSIDNYAINDTAFSNVNACITGGTFTIGGATADFPNIPTALSYLNGCSLTSPVVFNINPGSYTGQITLGTINGASATNTITFQAANGDSTSVVINYAAAGTADNWVVRLNQTKYVRFNKLTIQATGSTYGYAVYFNGGVQYNKFTNCVIKTVASTSSYFAGIYSPSTSVDKYNEFINNKIVNGYYSIYWYGTSSARKVGNIFENNIIQDFYYYGIYDYYNDSCQYIGNEIRNANPLTTNYPMYIYYNNGNTLIKKNKIDITSGNTLYGIYFYSAGAGCEISGNQIYQNTPSTNYGLYIYSVTGTSSSPTLVYNNMISLQGAGTGTTYGIYNSTNAYINMAYNTVSVRNGGTSYYALYSTGGSYLTLKNNVFANFVGGYAAYIGTASSLTASDYNDLYTTGTNLGYYSAARTSLAAWQTATSMDANSISIAPTFISNNDLHTFGIDLNGKGNPIAGISTDIDGELRNINTPDIGADEFTPPTVDAGIIAITSPVSPVTGGNNNVVVSLKNFGIDTLVSDSINWSVNNIVQPTYFWTGSLPTTNTTSVTIGSFNFVNGNYSIKVWSNHPNAVADMTNYNDTSLVNLTACLSPLSGTYTIGGTGADFPSITTAINSLKYCGVGGPVVFNINPGIYTEQIYVGNIAGTSSTNTITFTSAQSLNTSVTVQYNATSSQNYVWKLDTASYVRIRNISLKALNTNYGRVIELAGTTKYCIIDSCIIEAPNSTSSTTAGIYSGTSKDESNQILNNQIKNGYYGIYLQGVGTTNLELGNIVKNNTISNFYYYGLYLYYQDYLKVQKNTVTNSVTSATAYGIYASYCDNGLEITQNRVLLNPTTSAYAMYIYYCDGTANTYGLIANNFVSITTASSTAYGLYPYYSNYQNIVFNNVNVTSATTSRSVYSYYGGNLVYNNNNFVNAMSGGYAFYSASTTVSFASDYNNFFAAQTNGFAGYFGSAKATLADWQTATSGDMNSVSTDPGYFSNTNLHVTSVGLNNKGIPINGVLVDIDGQGRNVSTPDIGADEFTPQSKDAAPFVLVQPAVNYNPVGTSVTVEITLKNFGMDTLDTIPVFYKYGAGIAVSGLWTGSLAPNAQTNYTFTQTFNTIAGMQLLKVYTDVVGDQNLNNDTLLFNYSGIPILTLAYVDSFDGSVNNWVGVGSQNLWQRGTPAKTIINNAYTAPNVWITDLMNQYTANASNECLYSPYFDFSTITNATLKFRHWYETQANNDGGRIQYSTDGVIWANLGYIGDPNGVNWVNSNVGGIHQWTGSSSGWVLSTYNLSQFDNSPLPVQFRFNFNSNASTNGDGWAIDNFEITIPQAAIDAKMDAIITPLTSTVIGSTAQVKVRIKNNGTTILNTVPMNYTINGANQVAGQWTGSLNPGDTISYVFPTTFTSPTANYSLCATVIVPGDIYPQNDFVCNNINVIAPPLDAGVTHILHPDDTTTDPTVNHIVVVRIKNFGTTTLTSLNVQYTVGSTSPVIEQWTGNLLPDSTVDYQFTASYKPTTIGWYALCAKTNLTGDGWANNDAICKNKYSGTSIDDLWREMFSLQQNTPNPTKGLTEIRFNIPVSGTVNFTVTNLLGQSLYSVDNKFSSGENRIQLNSTDFAEGVYYYSIEINGHKLTKKMVIIR